MKKMHLKMSSAKYCHLSRGQWVNWPMVCYLPLNQSEAVPLLFGLVVFPKPWIGLSWDCLYWSEIPRPSALDKETLNTGLHVEILRPKQNGCHFTDNIFTCIFFNENVWILIKIWMKFVPKVWINNIPALVVIMAWHWPGDKPLSEPMMVRLPMHICIIWPQWVKISKLKQNGCHFADNIFICIFLKENMSNLVKNFQWSFLLSV